MGGSISPPMVIWVELVLMVIVYVATGAAIWYRRIRPNLIQFSGAEGAFLLAQDSAGALAALIVRATFIMLWPLIVGFGVYCFIAGPVVQPVATDK